MTTQVELAVKAALGLVAAIVVATMTKQRRRERWALSALALVSALAWFNWGTFHQVRYPHHGEMFHYVLGSKYFPELGHDGLYVASMQAQEEQAPRFPWGDQVRDLRRNALVDRHELADHQRQIRARFSDARWQSFVADHACFLNASDPGYIAALRRDHGYNPTPIWTTVARLFTSSVPVNEQSLFVLALLDPLLLVGMFGLVWRTFGWRRTALSITVFGLAFLSRFHWVGGAFLRHDWLFAVVAGICLLERKRPIAAGVAFGYAAATRLFPALFLFGIAVWGIRCWRKHEPVRWAVALGAAFLGTVLIAFLLGAAAGRGFEGWAEFAEHIGVHRAGVSRNRVGLFSSLVSLYDFLSRPTSAWGQVVGEAEWQGIVTTFRDHYWPLRALIVAGGLGVVARAAWRRQVVEAGVLGLVVVFLLTEPASYYWSALLLVPLLGRRWLTVALLGYSSLLCAIAALPGDLEVYEVAAHGMILLFAFWLLRPPPRETASGAHPGEGAPLRAPDGPLEPVGP